MRQAVGHLANTGSDWNGYAPIRATTNSLAPKADRQELMIYWYGGTRPMSDSSSGSHSVHSFVVEYGVGFPLTKGECVSACNFDPLDGGSAVQNDRWGMLIVETIGRIRREHLIKGS